MKQYDYLIVGAGLFGAVFAHEARKAGRRCLVIDRRSQHCRQTSTPSRWRGSTSTATGAHIFHTNSKEVWAYVEQFCRVQPVHQQPYRQLPRRDLQLAPSI